MTRLAVIVITKNEAHILAACLQSVAFADQIVVLDSGSTDDTLEIAKKMGAQVGVSTDWPGFGVQKNRALALANCDWVLSIDADERLTAELQTEIKDVLNQPKFDAYSLPRLSSYCGQYMAHSGWYPDRTVRLFRRGAARFSEDLVHERLIVQSPVLPLQADLLHQSFQDLESVLDKVNRYSSAGASNMQTKGRSASLGSAIAHGLWAFVRTYFFKLGLLDGRLGFVLAVSNAEGTYYRYLKLWLAGRERSGGAPPS